jgi:hypothetical protein
MLNFSLSGALPALILIAIYYGLYRVYISHYKKVVAVKLADFQTDNDTAVLSTLFLDARGFLYKSSAYCLLAIASVGAMFFTADRIIQLCLVYTTIAAWLEFKDNKNTANSKEAEFLIKYDEKRTERLKEELQEDLEKEQLERK